LKPASDLPPLNEASSGARILGGRNQGRTGDATRKSDADGRITRIRCVMPRHKAANWVGPGRKRKSTQPGASGVIELAPLEFLDRLAGLIPQPRRHRHRYHGVFAPNHPLRPAVTALAVGNVGKQRDPATGGHGGDGHGSAGCCVAKQKPRSHDTSRIAWAKLMARVEEEFPLLCPACGGDIRLISFITDPGPIRKILTHLGEPLEPPPVSPSAARRPTRAGVALADPSIRGWQVSGGCGAERRKPNPLQQAFGRPANAAGTRCLLAFLPRKPAWSNPIFDESAKAA
jgi:hypothetical protein